MITKFDKKGEGVLKNPWFYLLAIGVIALLVIAVRSGITGNVVADNIVPTGNDGPSNVPSVVDVSEDDDVVLGDVDAPVTIIEFSDYECPFCGRFVLNTLPQLKEEYIDTGKVKLIYRDFPLSFHQDAQKAAEATEVARELGGDEAYWQMHDKIFETAQMTVADLKGYARDFGLDGTAFDSLLDSGKYADEVQNDFQDGQKAGVSGTPTFFVNGRMLVGAQPFEAFQQIIEEELNG
jgi:protein-disulfide isomerase